MKAVKKKPEPILAFTRATDWHAWLAAHHDQSEAVLLRIAKTGAKSITYAEALDIALAWGWIDSRKQALDESAWRSASRRAAPKARGRGSTVRRRKA
jgi:uncharacterized protein YdeI (YjbR/CyaY-like superfamily)